MERPVIGAAVDHLGMLLNSGRRLLRVLLTPRVRRFQLTTLPGYRPTTAAVVTVRLRPFTPRMRSCQRPSLTNGRVLASTGESNPHTHKPTYTHTHTVGFRGDTSPPSRREARGGLTVQNPAEAPPQRQRQRQGHSPGQPRHQDAQPAAAALSGQRRRLRRRPH